MILNQWEWLRVTTIKTKSSNRKLGNFNNYPRRLSGTKPNDSDSQSVTYNSVGDKDGESHNTDHMNQDKDDTLADKKMKTNKEASSSSE